MGTGVRFVARLGSVALTFALVSGGGAATADAHPDQRSCAQGVRQATASGWVAPGPRGQGVSGPEVAGVAQRGPTVMAAAVARAHALFCDAGP
jgi:hypothetical protein